MSAKDDVLDLATYLFDCWNVIGRNGTSHDLIVECDVFSGLRIHFHRLDVTDDLGVLASTSGLFLVNVREIRPLGNRLAEGDAGLAGDTVNIVFPPHTFDVNFEMEFAHTRYDGLYLAGDEFVRGKRKSGNAIYLFTFLVHVDPESGILFLETIECTRKVGGFNAVCFDSE